MTCRRVMPLLACLVVVLLCAQPSNALGRAYRPRERVPVIVNNVGPYHNPAETYEYYSLPYCAPADARSTQENLGEVLAGDRRTTSLYNIRYGVDIEWQALCEPFKLSQDEIKWFSDAIREHYTFEFFLDDLPIRGFVGMMENSLKRFTHDHVHNTTDIFLFTHLDFSIAYNGGHVIAVNLTTDQSQRVRLELGKDITVEFSYSAHWHKTSVSYLNRMSLHSKSTIGDQSVEIHWLSIINSFVLVVLLTSFLAIILMRILKKDIAGYLDEDEEMGDDEEEGGWKLLHGDVFRPPPYLMLFTACVGTGAQIFALVVSILLLALVGTFYPGNRGALYTAAIILYALTASIAGYVSTSLYCSLGGEKWASNAVLAASLYALPFFMMFSCINSIALSYGSTSALPFGTIFVMILLWALVTFPLTIVGSIRGKKHAEQFDAPCKTNRAHREIPPSNWYRSTAVQTFMAGFLPFSAIYIELHYIFASVWGHRVYTLFGILFLAFVMLIIVTAFITVALTYFQLAVEDWRWWWRSFLSGGAAGFFIYAYAFFYYKYRSEMNGTLQGSFFFGYMFMISYAFFLMLGTIGWFTTLGFVRYIYDSIKVD